MRILIVGAYCLPYSGGYGQNIYRLAEGLVHAGHAVDILTCNTGKALAIESIKGVRVYRLPCWHLLGNTYPIPTLSLESVIMVGKVMKNRYDIINTQTRFFVTSLLGLAMAKLKHIPLVHTERGTRHVALPNKLLDIVSRIYDHTLGTLLVKSAKIGIGVSVNACGFLYHLGAKRLVVVHNGVDTEMFQSESRRSGLVITYAGRLVWAKGVQDLIEAFGMVKKIHKRAELFIIGDGNYRERLEVMAEGYAGVKFFGEVSHNELAKVLNASHVFVNPSYSEGLPTSVMEAMSVGLPVVATDVGGTCELVTHGETGILIMPNDVAGMAEAIEHALNNGNELGLIARRKMIDEYSWDKAVNAICEVYRQVI